MLQINAWNNACFLANDRRNFVTDADKSVVVGGGGGLMSFLIKTFSL